jgi:hypothetical protein
MHLATTQSCLQNKCLVLTVKPATLGGYMRSDMQSTPAPGPWHVLCPQPEKLSTHHLLFSLWTRTLGTCYFLRDTSALPRPLDPSVGSLSHRSVLCAYPTVRIYLLILCKLSPLPFDPECHKRDKHADDLSAKFCARM